MTIIDRYIINNPSKPAGMLAEEVGVSESFIKVRRELIAAPEQPNTMRITDSQEIEALLSLINERQTGWAVDIAKQRIRLLEKIRRK